MTTFWGSPYEHRALRILSETILVAHRASCSFPGANGSPCLWDDSEFCSISDQKEACAYYGEVCECEACVMAKEILKDGVKSTPI